MQTAAGKQYCFSGAAILEMVWLAECMVLFRQHGVIIRKLLLRDDLKTDTSQQALARHLEIDFFVPEAVSEVFMDLLGHKLDGLSWQYRQLK